MGSRIWDQIGHASPRCGKKLQLAGHPNLDTLIVRKLLASSRTLLTVFCRGLTFGEIDCAENMMSWGDSMARNEEKS